MNRLRTAVLVVILLSGPGHATSQEPAPISVSVMAEVAGTTTALTSEELRDTAIVLLAAKAPYFQIRDEGILSFVVDARCTDVSTTDTACNIYLSFSRFSDWRSPFAGRTIRVTLVASVVGASGVTSRAYEAAIRLIESGRVPLERMHTHDFALEEAAHAIELLAGEVPGASSIHSCLLPDRRKG